MAKFFGQEKCTVDASGRVKLSRRFEGDFKSLGTLRVVLHCLPEGGLAVYPLELWEQMRSEDTVAMAMNAGHSIVARRQLRRLNCMTQVDELSSNYRLTVPPEFRPLLALEPGTTAMLVGCGVGIEVWNSERWAAELGTVRAHEEERALAEMQADLGVIRENSGKMKRETGDDTAPL